MITALSQRAALSSRESGMNDRHERWSNGTTGSLASLKRILQRSVLAILQNHRLAKAPGPRGPGVWPWTPEVHAAVSGRKRNRQRKVRRQSGFRGGRTRARRDRLERFARKLAVLQFIERSRYVICSKRHTDSPHSLMSIAARNAGSVSRASDGCHRERRVGRDKPCFCRGSPRLRSLRLLKPAAKSKSPGPLGPGVVCFARA